MKQDALKSEIITKTAELKALDVDEDTVGFYIASKTEPLSGKDRVTFAAHIFNVLGKWFKHESKTRKVAKQADTQEELMAEIVAKVSAMIALNTDGDTIRFYVITKVGEAKNWSPMHKTFFVGTIENVLQKRGL